MKEIGYGESEMERKLRGADDTITVNFGRARLTIVRDQTYVERALDNLIKQNSKQRAK